MSTVIKAQTVHSENGFIEMFYGVEDPKFIRIDDNKNLAEELAAIYEQINKIQERIDLTATLTALGEANDKIASLEKTVESLQEQIDALKQPEANV
jgi:peptidoglycan hydrolase CwlO-like protein